jgi:hypothetical protein
MTPKQFEKYLARDRHCWHCGQEDDLIPHHRMNRGAGGKNSKANQSSNIIVMCARINDLMESNAAWAAIARERGWKLSSYQNPDEIPIFDDCLKKWFTINNLFAKTPFCKCEPDLNLPSPQN